MEDQKTLKPETNNIEKQESNEQPEEHKEELKIEIKPEPKLDMEFIYSNITNLKDKIDDAKLEECNFLLNFISTNHIFN